MPLTLANAQLTHMAIADDDPAARMGYQFLVEDMELVPIDAAGPYKDVTQLVREVTGKANALLCDYHLNMRQYAPFQGDEVVVACYDNSFPALLITAYGDHEYTIPRALRRKVPSLLAPDAVVPEVVLDELEKCIAEFRSEFRPSRKPWRTLVRVVEVDDEEQAVYVLVPGWDSKTKVRLRYPDFPDTLQRVLEPGRRFHALVNVGAERSDELYFVDWEIQ